MSGGCFRVVDLGKYSMETIEDDDSYKQDKMYIPTRNILQIHRYDNYESYAYENDECNGGGAALIQKLFETESIYPLYEIIVKDEDDCYLVHPSEREHMERYLAGTDNPLYDLVNELRYNPNLAFGSEVRAAKQDFESETKKRKK